MPLNPLLVIKASMTTHILHKKYWICIFGAYVGSLMQSKLQSIISSPKERVSKHCKIHQFQNQSSDPHHWASGCKSCSAPGTGSKGGKWYIPLTAFAGQPPASSWLKISAESYKINLALFTKQPLRHNCQTIKDTAKEQQGFHIYAIPENTSMSTRVQWPASMQPHCHYWGNCSLASGSGMVHRTQQPQRPDEISVMLKLRFGLCKILILCI